MSYLVSFCSCVLSIPITSLEEERANLSAVRTFVRFVLVWICRVSLSLSVWEGLYFIKVLGLLVIEYPEHLSSAWFCSFLNKYLTHKINVEANKTVWIINFTTGITSRKHASARRF